MNGGAVHDHEQRIAGLEQREATDRLDREALLEQLREVITRMTANHSESMRELGRISSALERQGIR